VALRNVILDYIFFIAKTNGKNTPNTAMATPYKAQPDGIAGATIKTNTEIVLIYLVQPIKRPRRIKQITRLNRPKPNAAVPAVNMPVIHLALPLKKIRGECPEDWTATSPIPSAPRPAARSPAPMATKGNVNTGREWE